SHPGYFAWEPPIDPLSEDSLIDMSFLNESEAGVNGFVRRDGDRFVLGNGESVRFWMVQGSSLQDMSEKRIDRWSRRLAKYGVNLVRVAIGSMFQLSLHNPEKFDEKLDRIHYMANSLKKQGIYVYFSHFFWHTSGSGKLTEDVFPGYGKGKQAISLLFFSEKFQDIYEDAVGKFMNKKNPYSGLPMSKDPVIAFYEIQNESSLFFWTFNPSRFPEVELAIMERAFGDWLKNKYGSLDAAKQAWSDEKGRAKHTPDKFEEGRAGLYNAGFLTGQSWAVNQRNSVRASDQLQFMVEAQKKFYENMTSDLKSEQGLQQLIVASNWKTADPKVLGGLERYTYTGSDVVCRNSYFGVNYRKGGQQRFYAIELNDTYTYTSALKPPSMPGVMMTPQPKGYPFMITENTWTRPNRYRVELPFLVSTFALTQGIDGWCFFALDSAEWQHQMAVWDMNNSSILAQFPATSLIFRKGYVGISEKPAASEKVSLEDAYSFKGTGLFTVKGKDALWESKIGDRESATDGTGLKVDPRMYFVGPVEQEFVSGKSELTKVSKDKYIDSQKNTVTNMAGGLKWDYGKGVVTVNTPLAQGACGFLGVAGTIELKDISIHCSNEYGSVLAVSLDGKPIAESGKVLIQTGTYDKPYGFKTRKVGKYERITNLGSYPLNVRKIKASVTFKNGEGLNAVVLDNNGYPTDRKAETTVKNGKMIIQLPEDSLYTAVKK
ncbi:MAG: hypothetical protein U9O87_04605, partial [Verrucomicrobiota bacterium]|nr:hypothetical protein [Verrucomicrobiota bacterium]